MQDMTRTRLPLLRIALLGIATVVGAAPALAQSQAQAQAQSESLIAKSEAARADNPNQVQVALVRQDQSDCTNSNVNTNDPSLVGGTVWVTRKGDTTNLEVAVTMKPKTTYNFYLKCVRQLSKITTDDEGSAVTTLSFPTKDAGNVFAFDMYPDGAPAGDKYQSVQVKFP